MKSKLFNLILLILIGMSSILNAPPVPETNFKKALTDITPEEFEKLAAEAKQLDEAIKNLPQDERNKVEQELEQFAMDVIENMPEDELNEFMQFSGKLAERLDLDEEEFMPPTFPTKEKEEEEIKTIKKNESPPSTTEVKETATNKEEAQNILQNIIDKLDSIRIKAANDPDINEKINNWEKKLNIGNKPLDDLKYYLEVIKEDKYIKYLLSEDFKYLLENLKKLNNELSEEEPKFQVPEFGIGKLDSSTKKTSQKALNIILKELNEAIFAKNILGDMQNLLKKYAPEELEKKKKREKEEQKAARESEAALRKSEYQPTGPVIVSEPSYGRRGFGGFVGEDIFEPSYSGSNYYGASSNSYRRYSPQTKRPSRTTSEKTTKTSSSTSTPRKSQSSTRKDTRTVRYGSSIRKIEEEFDNLEEIFKEYNIWKINPKSATLSNKFKNNLNDALMLLNHDLAKLKKQLLRAKQEKTKKEDIKRLMERVNEFETKYHNALIELADEIIKRHGAIRTAEQELRLSPFAEKLSVEIQEHKDLFNKFKNMVRRLK